MFSQSLYTTYKRHKSLYTHRISALPIAILMPHSACNCRCVMCDIWKDNKNLQQLTEEDIAGMLQTFQQLGTKMVVMSGGEALLNSRFFTLCSILKKQNINICLLSTGLGLAAHAENIITHTDEVIVSLDGDAATHNQIRNIPQAFEKMQTGIAAIKALKPDFKITGRSVIHRLNYTVWPQLIKAAKTLGLQQISFLPADVSSHAFNRAQLWDKPRQEQVVPTETELPALQAMLNYLFSNFKESFDSGYIAESPAKLQKIHDHYAAYYGLGAYPAKRCNAPWVSVVVEADGTVRPCFFHEAVGNAKELPLGDIINSPKAIAFRRQLDVAKNETCQRCVCYLNLPPGAKV